MNQKTYKTGFVITGDAKGAVKAATSTDRSLDSLNKTKKKASGYAKEYARDVGSITNSLSGMKGIVGSAIAALGIFQGYTAFKDINVEAETLRGSLVTITGSTERAAMAFELLEEFASKTPYTLDQSIEGFIKLGALGLTPSERALRSYGNTASALGKDLNQMIEAVADASTGEFERLKEFGIKSKSQGDEVSFTFQGVTTTVKKNASEIEGYLQNIGETKFGDAMANQMERLPGLFSNMEDSAGSMWRAMGDSGGIALLATGISAATASFNYLTENMDSVIATAGTLASIVGAGGALYLAMVGTPLIVAAASAAYGYLARSVANVTLAYSLGLGPVGMFTASISASALATKAAVLQFGILKTVATGVFAAFAGWEIGTLIRNQFVEARVAGLAFVGVTLEGFETIRYAWEQLTSQTLTELWDTFVVWYTGKWSSLIQLLADGLDLIGADEIAVKFRSFADSIVYTAERTAEFKEKMAALKKEHLANIGAIQENVTALVKYELATDRASKTTEKTKETLADLGSVAGGLAESSEEVSDEFAKSWEKATERIDAAFADAWKGAFDSFGDFADKIKNAFTQLMAELIHQATTKKILISLGLGTGSSSAFSSGSGGGGSSGFGSLTGLLAYGKDVYSGFVNGGVQGGLSSAFEPVSNAYSSFMGGGTGGATGGMVVDSGTGMLIDMGSDGASGVAGGSDTGTSFDFTNAAITAIAAYAGTKVGNAVGEAVFGKEAESAWGATIGSAIGAIWGPYTAALGGAIGGMVDVAFGGDGLKDVTLGVVNGADKGGLRSKYTGRTETSDSGLVLSAVNRRGGGDATNAADTLLDGFLAIDTSLLMVAQSLGQTVDFTGQELGGKQTNGAQTAGNGFFGSAEYNEFNEDDFRGAAGRFANEWADAAGGAIDDLFDTLAGGFSDVELSENLDQVLQGVLVIGGATGELKAVFDSFVPTLDDVTTTTEEVMIKFGEYGKDFSRFNNDIKVITKTVSAFPFEDLARDGEIAVTTLLRLVGNTVGANQALEQINLSLFSLDETGIRTANSLVEIFGSLEGLNQATSAYYAGFFSQAEQIDLVGEQLASTFAEIGVSMPSTRSGFRALVESLDLTAVAGQETFAALMALSPAMAEYFTAIDSMPEAFRLANGSVEQLTQSVSEISQAVAGARGNITSQIGRITGVSADASISTLRSQLGQGESLDQVANINLLQDAIGKRYDSEARAISSAMAAAEQAHNVGQKAAERAHAARVSEYERLIDLSKQLSGYVDSLLLSDLSPLTAQQRLVEAKGQYGQTLLQAQAGNVDAISGLQGAADNYLGEARSFYASNGQYTDIFNDVVGAVEGVSAGAAGATNPGDFVASAFDGSTFAAQLVELQTEAVSELSSLDTMLQELQSKAEEDLEATLSSLNDQLAADNAALLQSQNEQTKLLSVLPEKLDSVNALLGQQVDKSEAMIENAQLEAAKANQAAADLGDRIDTLIRRTEEASEVGLHKFRSA